MYSESSASTAQNPENSDTTQKLVFDQAGKKWSVKINGIDRKVSENAKTILEEIDQYPIELPNNQDLSRITGLNVGTVSQIMVRLRGQGMIEGYKKNGAHQTIHYKISGSSKAVSDKYTPWKRNSSNGVATNAFGKSKEFVPPPVEPIAPENNPSTKLLNIPFIGMDPETDEFKRIKASFDNGVLDNFQRATLVKNGKATPGAGRWVYVGERHFAP